MKVLAYAMAWINTCIILHAFCMNEKLDLHRDWLRDEQRFEQNLRIQTDQSKEIERNERKQVREDL